MVFNTYLNKNNIKKTIKSIISTINGNHGDKFEGWVHIIRILLFISAILNIVYAYIILCDLRYICLQIFHAIFFKINSKFKMQEHNFFITIHFQFISHFARRKVKYIRISWSWMFKENYSIVFFWSRENY